MQVLQKHTNMCNVYGYTGVDYRFEKLIVNQKTNFVVGKLAYRIKLGKLEA